jgi:glutamate---cysteine ligase / carboxylate-amine ligase
MLLVDPDTGVALALADLVTDDAEDTPQSELQRQQVETDTAPCTSLDELAGQIRQQRRVAADAAGRKDCEVVALGTSPLAVSPVTTQTDRYLRMAEEYALTAQEQLTCGCHVHVRVESDEEGVAVLDRIRPWLPVVLAMTANSPFWQERDTGYASYRQQVWGRWPSAGPAELFGTPKIYHETIQAMIDSGALLDEGMVYFDARLSRHYPTVEIRTADVCMLADDAVLIAALARGLVETAAREWRAGEPPSAVRTEVLCLASWRASRSGLDGDLVHPVTARPVPAEAAVQALIEHVSPVLEDIGDLGTVTELTGRLMSRGNGARLQRRAYEEAGDLAAVVRDAVARTLGD